VKLVLRFFLLFFFSLSLLLGCTESQAKPSDKQLEEQVLDIIRRNPQVIIESVQKYQQDQANAQIQQRFKQVVGEPVSIIRQSPTTGSPDRKIILAEFSDFQCPFCARAHNTVKEFMAKHKDKVTLTYKHFPLQQIHPEALPAARASWAAAQQQKFWEFHDQLFAEQSRLGEGLYTEIAQKLGLNLDQFNTDRNSKTSEDAVLADFQLGRELGIEGTPAFFLNDRFFSGAVSLAEMEEKLSSLSKYKD
jgi:protein-disulfide isomerase